MSLNSGIITEYDLPSISSMDFMLPVLNYFCNLSKNINKVIKKDINSHCVYLKPPITFVFDAVRKHSNQALVSERGLGSCQRSGYVRTLIRNATIHCSTEDFSSVTSVDTSDS